MFMLCTVAKKQLPLSRCRQHKEVFHVMYSTGTRTKTQNFFFRVVLPLP